MLVGLDPQGLQATALREREDAVAVHREEHDGRVGDDGAPEFLAGAQRGLGLLARRDVGANPDPLADATVVVPPRRVAEGVHAQESARRIDGGVRLVEKTRERRDAIVLGERL